MKKLIFLPTIMVSSLVFAADTAYSPPVGGAQVTCSQGMRFSGMPFLNPAITRELISSNTSSTVTLGNATINMASVLNSTKAYYLEIIDGPTFTYVGDRFDVDVTATIASANNTVSILAGSTTNTLSSLPASLDGYTLAIRPHVTLGQLFGVKNNELMNGSTIVSTADQVLFLNTQTQAFETYYFLRNGTGTIAQWTKVGGGSTNRDATIIPPGTGVVVIRNIATPVTLTWLGDVRLNSFVQPLVAGLNLVAEPIPVTNSPVSRAMTYANGMTGSTISGSADQILINNAGVYSTYYLLRNGTGTIEQWTLVGGGSTNHNNTVLFNPTGAVVIRKIAADSNYLIPYTLSL